LGFSVGDSGFALGGVDIELGKPGSGIVGWTLVGIDPTGEIDGLPTTVSGPSCPPHVDHENGALAVDHVVVMTTDFDRTAAALEHAGMPLRRTITSPSGNRMGFRRLGPAILELVEGSDGDGGRARFWGLVVIVKDLEALAARLGDRLGSIRDAVQPGRRIATVRESAGLGQPLAFMTLELRSAKT
jgi:hypothetical protein